MDTESSELTTQPLPPVKNCILQYSADPGLQSAYRLVLDAEWAAGFRQTTGGAYSERPCKWYFEGHRYREEEEEAPRRSGEPTDEQLAREL